tara:strand:+ start:2355 stop:3113 length:759 start_codon:yes stop_codon:yes gene_type:complete
MDDLPLPPPPPGLTMPPPQPTELDTQFSETPPMPNPPPPLGIDVENESPRTTTEQESDLDEDFNSAWAKRKQENPALSADKRDQMYGHIDRIATGEVGTLMDRFSDRFGSELDREIIVLRKKQQAEMRNIKPTVELISAPETEFEEEEPEEESEPVTEEIEGTDEFNEFFSVVNDLLGSMPDDFVNNFIESDDFTLFQSVGNNPIETDEDARKEFFLMINRVLGDLPDDKINEFVQSPGFTIFQSMGEIYGA